MAADFLAALIDHWTATPALVAISPVLHRDVAPPPPAAPTAYPYACITQIGTAAPAGRSTGKGYWVDEDYQITIFHTEPAAARAIGDAMDDILLALDDAPLTFDGGYQMAFRGTGDMQFRIPRDFARTGGFLYHDSHTYKVRIGRVRP